MYAQGFATYPGPWSDRRTAVRAGALHPDRRAVRRPARRSAFAVPNEVDLATGVDVVAFLKQRPWIIALGGALVALTAGVTIAIAASNAVLRDIAKPNTIDSDTAAGIAQNLVDEQNLTDTSRAPKIASPAFLAATEAADPYPVAPSHRNELPPADLRAEPTAQPQRFYDDVQPVNRGVQIQASNGGSIVIHWSDEERGRNKDRSVESVRQPDPRASRDELF